MSFTYCPEFCIVELSKQHGGNMRVIKVVPNNGRDTLYVKGTPNPKILPKQDYDALIASLELEIRNYYKEQDTSADLSAVRPP